MATKKVKGYMLNRGGWIEFHQSPDPAELWVPCTMVLPERADDPVYTASEVRAMLKEISEKEYSYRESTDIVDMYDVETVFAKHGITLDPA